MKILHLISQAPDFTGSGKYIQAMLRCAAAKGYDNFLLAGVQDRFVMDSGLISPDRCRFVRFKGEDLPYPLPGMSDAMPYENTIFSQMSCEALDAYEAVFKKAISDAVARFQPDIIHSHHLWLVTVTACETAPHIPVVTTCHGTCLRQFTLCPEIRPKVEASCSRISRVIALSEHQKREIEAVHAVSSDRIHVIPGGYDDSLFYPGENSSMINPSVHACADNEKQSGEPQKTPKCVEILYAGKLCRAKGVPWLLNALKQVDIHQHPWRLHMAGSGSGTEEAQCLELANALGNRVVVHGALSHTDLGDLMRQCHLFVLPSFFEGLPLVLMEALACGCRVLTTALPGTREVLGREAEKHPGQLVNFIELPPLETVDRPFEKDLPLLEAQLADSLKTLINVVLEDPRPDHLIFKELTRPYSWEKIFERIDAVYQMAYGN